MLFERSAEIERFVESPEPKTRAAVIWGLDPGLVRERADRLARAVTARPDDPFDSALLDEAALLSRPGRLEEELSAISMLGGRRLVRLRLSACSTEATRLAASALEGHLAEDFNPEAYFLIEAPELKKASPLARLAHASPLCAGMICYEDRSDDLERLVRRELALDGVELDADALSEFVQRLPANRLTARQEIQRLVLFVGPDKRAGASDLEAFFGVEPESSLYRSLGEAFGGHLAESLEGLRRALGEGLRGPDAVAAAQRQIGKLRRAGALHQAGSNPRQAAKAVGVFWKEEREFLRQLAIWTRAALDSQQMSALQAD
ncbi:MAG: DNA polymerase III subunit delta, partial [Caulobacteraceae bacterium]